MKRKICFVALGSYPLFSSNENLQYVGGAEIKQILVAEELSKRGFNITFITYEEEGEKKEAYKDISIIQSFSPSQHLTLFTKARRLWNSLKKSDAEIYIQSGGTPGLIPIYCLIHRKKYIKWLSCNKNVLLEGIHKKITLLTKMSLYIDIKFAHVIIAQNEFQKDIIVKKFKKHCVLIKNPIKIPSSLKVKEDKKAEKNILWIGTIGSVKQPELYLKIAEALPMYKFKIIGGRNDNQPEYYDVIKLKAKKISNLEFIGFVPYHKIQEYYKDACLLVNTSTIEGFPNTFLEAWLNYLPIVSLNVDPDEIICNNSLGFHSKTFGQIIHDIDGLLKNDSLRETMGKNGRKYVEEYHNLEKIADQFDALIKSFN